MLGEVSRFSGDSENLVSRREFLPFPPVEGFVTRPCCQELLRRVSPMGALDEVVPLSVLRWERRNRRAVRPRLGNRRATGPPVYDVLPLEDDFVAPGEERRDALHLLAWCLLAQVLVLGCQGEYFESAVLWQVQVFADVADAFERLFRAERV